MEYGYTPKNLTAIMLEHGLSSRDVAEITNTKNTQSVKRWEMDLSNPLHADMPCAKWVVLLEHLGIDKVIR